MRLLVVLCVACGASTGLDGAPSEGDASTPADVKADIGAEVSPATTLVSLAGGRPIAIAVDATDVYWSNDEKHDFTFDVTGSIMKCAKDGCGGNPTVLVSNVELFGWDNFSTDVPTVPHRLAVNATSVYWTAHDGSVLGCAKSGCQVPTTIATNQQHLGGIAADDANVYWVVSFDLSGGLVMTCPAGGCGGQPTPIASHQAIPFDIAIDGKSVYWSDIEGVMTCAMNGCTSPVRLASTVYAPFSLATVGSNVLWAQYDGIEKCPKGGCGADASVVATEKQPSVIAADENNAYWGGGAPRSLMRCAVSACTTPAALVPIPSGDVVYDMAVDSTSVYWTSGSAVMKLTPK